MTTTSHKHGKELKLKKHIPKYKKCLAEDIKNNNNLTVSQKEEIIQLIYDAPAGLRKQRVKLEKTVKKSRKEMIKENKNTRRINPYIRKITVQSKIPLF